MKRTPALLIAKKRDGQALSKEEIDDLVSGVVDGSLSDSQLGALLMAGYFQGASFEETAHWTAAMRDSGHVHELSHIEGVKVDKHSTGGVGDKVSIVLAPLVAACGVQVPMVSGPGLGHTGGTVDKLKSIPGFKMDLDPESYVRVLEQTGLVMSAATEDLAPADRRMYGTRDVTATVESIPWITSSILSKKLAEGIDALSLDVKCGRGAFMKDLESASALARSLVRTATELGVRCKARITDMDQPLGRAVGNALEIRECLDCMRGKGPEDLLECVLILGSDMLELAGAASSEAEARQKLLTCIRSGATEEKFLEMLRAQGGDPRVVEDPDAVLGSAPVRRTVTAETGSFVSDLDPYAVGVASLELGAGRKRAGDPIDPVVGVLCLKKAGDRVERGSSLFEIHARDEDAADRAEQALRAAIVIGPEECEDRPLLLATISGDEDAPKS